MVDKDPIKDLFSDRLKDLEAPVNPSVWTSISTSLATGSTVASGGLSLVSKIIIGSSLVAATATGIYFSTQSNSLEKVYKSQNLIHKTDNSVKSSTLASKSIQQEKELNLDIADNQSTFIHPLHVESNFKNEGNEHQLSLENNSKEISSTVTAPVHQTELNYEQYESTTEVKNSVQQHSIQKKIETTPSETSFQHEVEKVQLNLPNIFSPNGDGSNDFFYLTDAEQLSDFSIAVMNMNNQVVFSSSDTHFKWDGTDLSGNPLTAGKYMYIVIGRSANNQTVRQFSYLQIVK